MEFVLMEFYCFGNLGFENMIASLLFSGVIYTIMIGICVFLFHALISSSKQEILHLIN